MAKKRKGLKIFFFERHQFAVGIFFSIFIFVFASFGLVVANGESVRPTDSHLVSMIIDGNEEIVPSRAPTVGELIKKQAVEIGPADAVEPSLDTPIDSDNFKVQINRAVPTTIVDNGIATNLLSPYSNPRRAVEEAGIKLYPADEVALEYPGDPASSQIIGRKLVVSRATLIYVNVYGTLVEHRTNKKVVSEVLKEMSILPESEDSVLPSYATPVTANLVVSITRFGQQVVNEEEVISPPVETIVDKNMPFGSSEVREAGAPGKKIVTYELKLENNIEVSRNKIQETVILEPVKKVVASGANVVLSDNKEAIMIAAGLSPEDYAGADFIISHESGWCATKWQGQWGHCPPTYQEKYPGAESDSSVGFGLCQSTPAIKMATAGDDWRTNAITQLKWCTGYARSRYGSWQNAYNTWQARAAAGHGWW